MSGFVSIRVVLVNIFLDMACFYVSVFSIILSGWVVGDVNPLGD